MTRLYRHSTFMCHFSTDLVDVRMATIHIFIIRIEVSQLQSKSLKSWELTLTTWGFTTRKLRLSSTTQPVVTWNCDMHFVLSLCSYVNTDVYKVGVFFRDESSKIN